MHLLNNYKSIHIYMHTQLPILFILMLTDKDEWDGIHSAMEKTQQQRGKGNSKNI